MAFKKVDKKATKYPTRYWLLEGIATSGKSTFAAQMKTPLLAIDADHRFNQVHKRINGEVYALSDKRTDNVDHKRIHDLMAENMEGSDVQTIVVDSLTAILTPHIVQTMLDTRAGKNKNQMAGWVDKALVMRSLQDSVSRWGCDVLWISHLSDRRNNNADVVQRPSLTKVELEGLRRSLNIHLRLVVDGSKRGVYIVWAREGNAGVMLWDEVGYWMGMPERIEQAVYEQPPVYTFDTKEAAIAWSIKEGVFTSPDEAEDMYTLLKKQHNPKSAPQMFQLWGEKVNNLQRKVIEQGVS